MEQKKNILDLDISFGRVSLVQKALFAKHLSVALKAGLPIIESLEIARDSTTGKLKKTLSKVLEAVKSGSSVSKAFNRYPKVFSGLFIGVTSAGEASGTLVENLENISIQLEKEKDLLSKIKGAMLYPIVVLGAAFILGLTMAFLVLPKITPLFEGLKMNLPFTTRALIWFSNFIQNNGLIFFISIVFFVVFLIWLVRQKFSRPITHYLLLKSPVVKKISRNTNIARFCRTLGTLLKSGLTIDQSLEITKNTVGNYYYKKVLEQIVPRIGKGGKLSENLDQFSNLFPIIVTKMIKVGEESGSLEEALFYLADFYEVEVNNATKSLSTIIEPVLLIIIGLVVAFLALSIITPIYEITGNIKR